MEDNSLLGRIKKLFATSNEEPKKKWNSKDWIEIKAPHGSEIVRNDRAERPAPQARVSVPTSVTSVRPLAKERLQKERTSYTGSNPTQPLSRLSQDELKKKFPGAFEQRR